MRHVIGTKLVSFLCHMPILLHLQREDGYRFWPSRELEEGEREEECSTAFFPRVRNWLISSQPALH